jgi:hypothetical protein
MENNLVTYHSKILKHSSPSQKSSILLLHVLSPQIAPLDDPVSSAVVSSPLSLVPS